MRSISLFVLAASLTAFAADSVRLEVETIHPGLIQQRLETVKRDLSLRRETLEALFRETGCADLTTQPVPGSKQPNIVCTLPAASDDASTIVVGGHFDMARAGEGAIDDWSGVSLLPSLYQTLAKHPRRHRFVFAGFAGEEAGLFGSKEYVKKLGKEQRAAVAAMVNLECLGVAAPAFWASRANPRLGNAYVNVARSLGLPAAGVNVDNVGDDDSHPFKDAKIPVITFHSINQQNLPLLHSIRDNLKAIDPKHHYDAYRLAALYLAYIDSILD